MPHQCVRCSEIYTDGDEVILKGCPCGGKLFFYLSEKKLQLLKERDEKNNLEKLSEKDKKELEKDVLEIVGDQKSEDEPIILDFESVRITGPGKYELDLVNLFKKDPVIFKLDDGKYVIDLPETFKKIQERKGVQMPDEKKSKKKKKN